MARNRAAGRTAGDEAGQSVSAAWAREQIAKIFRDLRTAAGHTQAETAEYLFRHVGSYGNIERADPRVSFHPNRDIRRMVEFCGADDKTLQRLLKLADDTKQNSPFTQYRDVMSAEFGTYAEMERAAESIDCYMPELIPGIFQTEAYARQIAGLPGTDGRSRRPDEISTRVALRLQRQEVVTRAQNPLKVMAILSEVVLRSPVGGHRVMADQLGHLLRLSRLRNVTVRVVPLDTGLHLGKTTGEFMVLHFPNGATPPIVYADGFLGDSYFKGRDEVQIYDAALANIVKHALNVKESKAFIENVAKELAASD